jgi:hypothetical protein
MKNISLRRFRAEIAETYEAVEVSRRDPEGNIQLLGYWTPYVTYPDAKPLEPLRDQAPVPGGTTAIRDAKYVQEERVPLEITDDEPGPRVIRTPAEVAVAVAVNPVRAVPKPSQRKRR